jgi:activator of HSP90 ATPase
MITAPILPNHRPSRRDVVFRVLISMAAAAITTKTSASGLPQSMKEAASASDNQNRTSLHQEIPLPASPQRIYNALLDSKQFAAFSGQPAQIDPKPGGAFSMFGGLIEGRNLELVPNQRIVQGWRPASWESGIYSIVKFELKPQGSDTTVVLDHSSFPLGNFDHLTEGWYSHYWEPLKKYFAK